MPKAGTRFGYIDNTENTTQYSFVVPPGVVRLFVRLKGEGGGGPSNSSRAGGESAIISGWLPVTPGETVTFHRLGGGQGGRDELSGNFQHAYSGGAAVDVRQGGTALANRVAVAGGGGGGGGGSSSGDNGGNAGQSTGGSGSGSAPGQGGTQSAGGAAGGAGATAGSSGQGGEGIDAVGTVPAGGGGGGGYFGGGGAGHTGISSAGSGGGGGSCLIPSGWTFEGLSGPPGTHPTQGYQNTNHPSAVDIWWYPIDGPIRAILHGLSSTGSSTRSVTYQSDNTPAGAGSPVAGDVVVCAATGNKNEPTDTWTAPAGFTLLANPQGTGGTTTSAARQWVWAKTLSAAETSWSFTGPSDTPVHVVVLRGVKAGASIGVASSVNSGAIPSVAVNRSGSALLAFLVTGHYQRFHNFTVASMAEIAESGSDQFFGEEPSGSFGLEVSGSSSGARSFTGSGQGEYIATALVFEPDIIPRTHQLMM